MIALLIGPPTIQLLHRSFILFLYIFLSICYFLTNVKCQDISYSSQLEAQMRTWRTDLSDLIPDILSCFYSDQSS